MTLDSNGKWIVTPAGVITSKKELCGSCANGIGTLLSRTSTQPQ